MNDAENDSILHGALRIGQTGAVRYSLSKYNVDSPIRLNLILTDSNHNIVYTSYGNDDMNLHRIAFNGIVCDNTVKKRAGPLSHSVLFYRRYLGIRLFPGRFTVIGQLIGFAGAYLNGHDWARLFSNYQYDSIITTANGGYYFLLPRGISPGTEYQ